MLIECRMFKCSKSSNVPMFQCSNVLMFHWSIGPLVNWSIGLLVQWSSGPVVQWSIDPLVHWSLGPLVHWSLGPLVHWLNVKCQKSISLNFCWSVPPEFLRSFFIPGASLAEDSRDIAMTGFQKSQVQNLNLVSILRYVNFKRPVISEVRAHVWGEEGSPNLM